MPFDPLSFGIQAGTSIWSMLEGKKTSEEQERLRKLGIGQITQEIGKFPALEQAVQKMYGQQLDILSGQQGRSVWEAYKGYEGQMAQSGFSGSGALQESFANQRGSIYDVFAEKRFGALEKREQKLGELEDWKRNLRIQRASLGYSGAEEAGETLGLEGGNMIEDQFKKLQMYQEYEKYRSGLGPGQTPLPMDEWAKMIQSGGLANPFPQQPGTGSPKGPDMGKYGRDVWEQFMNPNPPAQPIGPTKPNYVDIIQEGGFGKLFDILKQQPQQPQAPSQPAAPTSPTIDQWRRTMNKIKGLI